MTEYVPVHKKLVLSDIFECTKYKSKLSSSMCTEYCLPVIVSPKSYTCNNGWNTINGSRLPV